MFVNNSKSIKFSTIFSIFILLIVGISISPYANSASKVKGHIDRISKISNNYYAVGWACQTGRNTSIEVRLFAGGRAGHGGKYFARGMANQNSEPGVATACGSKGRKHRFKVLIPRSAIAKYGNKGLHIHGISSIGSGNLQIGKSGTYKLPVSTVKGNIEGIVKQNDNYYARGWACQRGFDDSMGVHLYAGGAAGQGGKYIVAGTANRSSESGVANACGSAGTKHRFLVLISDSILSAHGGKTLYVHGLSTIGTSNLAISKSGQHSLPAPSKKVIYIHTDLLGTPVAESDENGNIVQ